MQTLSTVPLYNSMYSIVRKKPSLIVMKEKETSSIERNKGKRRLKDTQNSKERRSKRKNERKETQTRIYNKI